MKDRFVIDHYRLYGFIKFAISDKAFPQGGGRPLTIAFTSRRDYAERIVSALQLLADKEGEGK